MISFGILTWNLQQSQQVDLSPFIKRTLSPSPEFLVFSFQELQSPFSLSNLSLVRSEQAVFQPELVGSFESMKVLYLEVLRALDLGHRGGAHYKPCYVGKKDGLGLIIMAKDTIKVVKVYSGFLGTGLLGVHSNKGAISVCLEFGYPGQSTYSASIVNCHLGAHAGRTNFEKRHGELDHILEYMRMKPFPNDFSGDSVKVNSSQVIFVAGDLNFRLDTAMLRNHAPKIVNNVVNSFQGIEGKPDQFRLEPESIESTVRFMIRNNDYKSLLVYDELLNSMRNNYGLISIFTEPPIKFLPTYKKYYYNRNLKTSNSEELYDFKRIPAYTDRILYTTNEKITPLVYTSLDAESKSDHDCVMGLYILEFSSKCNIKSDKEGGVLFARLRRIYKVNRVGLFLTVLIVVAAFAFRGA